MNHDDESFLSAFIDGEMAPDQQQRLESAIVSNPHLAERLRSLVQVRDLVAGLPHDGSVDVTASVLVGIAARGRQRGFLPTLEGWRQGSRRILPLAGLAASAASLMVAASLAILMQASHLEQTGQAVARVAHPKVGTVSNPTASRAREQGSGQTTASVAVSASSVSEGEAGAVPKDQAAGTSVLAVATGSGGAVGHEVSSSSDIAIVRQFLDSGNLKRFFWVRGGAQSDSVQVVASIVERTTHFDFFKITIAQGIVIDPRHPEGATVLACVVDPNQLERFNDQLNAALPGLVSQEPLDPVIATQLVEIERVQSCPPMSLGEVEIPRESLALRTRSSVVSEKGHGEAEGAAAQRGAGRTRTASDRDSEASQAARSGSGGDAPVAGSSSVTDQGSASGAGKERSLSNESEAAVRSRIALEQKAVVLVWVGKSPED